MLTGYTIYYVLGYFLNRTNMKSRSRLFAYILGAIGFLMTILLTFSVSHQENRLVEDFFDNLTLNLLLSTAGVFVWFKYKTYTHIKVNQLMAKLSKYSFGAYIIHMFVIYYLKGSGFPNLFPNPVFRILCTSVTTFIISFIISAALNQIPIIKKYLV